MLAGPNGSGKSSLILQMLDAVNMGVVVNADEIEAVLKAQPPGLRLLNLHHWQLTLINQDLTDFGALPDSQRLAAATRAELRIEENVLLFQRVKIDSYLAAWVAELLRHYLLRSAQTLTFETVMSHPSKLEFLREARQLGYRTYLYFVGTRAPEINLTRIKARVAKGGHPVADNKVVERYHRSLALLRPALAHTDRAFIFDNSDEVPRLIAEVTAGREVEFKTADVPAWVEQVFR